MSLPQITSQMIPAINNSTIARMILVIILRFLDTGFFTFFFLEVGKAGSSSASLGSVWLALSGWGLIGVSVA